ncbi:MAG: endonuclease III domain-containing protein [Patescibacteria group bacterium]|jgi:endonuclease-3
MQKVTIYELYDILERATKGFPEPLAEHVFHWTKSPFFTLVSTVLSARTKDSLTITKLPDLWSTAKTPLEFSQLTTERLEPMLRPIGFYKTKARHLIDLGVIVHQQYHDVVPSNMEDLLKLPGVGRKTANLQLSVVNNIPAICVDTHVHRIMNHIGYVKTSTPEQTEFALRKKLPMDLWNKTNYLLVLTGQNLANHIQIKDPNNILNTYELIERVR